MVVPVSAKRQVPHIKRHTAGTSNELSFDVLDATLNELDGKKSSSRFRVRTPKGDEGKSVSFLFSGMEGVPAAKQGKQRAPEAGSGMQASMSTLTAQDEVSRRKKARRAHNIRIRVIAVLAVAFVLAAAGTYVYHVIQEQRAFDEKYAELAARFSSIDTDIVAADTLMGGLFDADAAEARNKTLDAIPRTRNNLAVVKTQAESLQKEAKSTRDQMAVGQMVEAIDAREEMMAVAQQTIELANHIEQGVANANETWANALEADQLARQAVQAANAANSDEGFQAAKEAADAARDEFEGVLYSLEYLENTLSGLDLSAQRAFVEKKIEALGYEAATNQAIIDGNRDAAIANNDAYNRADVEAAALADGLPASLEPMVRSLFDDELTRLSDAYDNARSHAIAADAIIRDYLGE